MALVGGYSSSEEEDAQGTAPKQARTSKPAANGRKVIDFSKLPVRRPVVFDDIKPEEPDAPLRAAAEAENLRLTAGRSLLAALPAPKVTLGLDSDLGGGGSRLDLSGLKRPRKQENPDVLFSGAAGSARGSLGVSAPDVTETGEIPADVMNHPMFRNDERAGAGGDRPNAEALHAMAGRKFTSISAGDIQDPDWQMSQMINGPGLNGKVSQEVSMYEAKSWQQTTHANPTKNQKKKHQINWMAHEAMEKESEMLERAASSRQTKAQTSSKYGW